jgi:hypothetical protein
VSRRKGRPEFRAYPKNLEHADLSSLPPPCFNWRKCRRHSELEKQGKSLCRPCAAPLAGVEYPLRLGMQRPLTWWHGSYGVVLELDMIEHVHRRNLPGFQELVL